MVAKRRKLSLDSESANLNIREELENEHDFVLKIINSIPPKAYFRGDVLEYLEDQKVKATEETVKGFQRQGRKEVISTKGKQKLARLDPNQHKTVEQVQDELYATKKPKKIKFSSTPRSTNIEELQEVLKKKIDQLRSARNKDGIKKREKHKPDKRKNSKKKRDFVKQTILKKETPKSKGLNTKPIFNKDGKMVFSKFDLAGDGGGSGGTRDKKKKLDKGNKALKKSLKKVEIEKEKLEKLKSQDPVKAQAVGDSKLWQKVLKKAEGEKVKDDPEKIKASLKKREKTKRKSQKGWAERTENLNKKMKERQDKRDGNIQKKKRERKDKKMKQLKKKGRMLPAGF